MRITVISDSHGNTAAIRRALCAQKLSNDIFFLGDCVRDIEAVRDEYPNKNFYIVSGNCDFHSFAPSTNLEIINNTKILYTHGHSFFVKRSTAMLLSAAAQRGVKIALFGHTHIPLTLYENGIYLVNPGSIGNPRNSTASYAVIDINDNGIMPIIINLG